MEETEASLEQPLVSGSEEKRGFPGMQMMMIFLGCSLLMTLGWGGMTDALIFASRNSRGAPTSWGRAVSIQALNNRSQEDVMTSTIDLHLDEGRTMPKAAAPNPVDERKKV